MFLPKRTMMTRSLPKMANRMKAIYQLPVDPCCFGYLLHLLGRSLLLPALDLFLRMNVPTLYRTCTSPTERYLLVPQPHTLDYCIWAFLYIKH